MGLVTIMRSNYLQLTNGLFFIKDEKGTYERVNKDGTKTRGHASNGFQCYLKSAEFETKTPIPHKITYALEEGFYKMLKLNKWI